MRPAPGMDMRSNKCIAKARRCNGTPDCSMPEASCAAAAAGHERSAGPECIIGESDEDSCPGWATYDLPPALLFVWIVLITVIPIAGIAYIYTSCACDVYLGGCLWRVPRLADLVISRLHVSSVEQDRIIFQVAVMWRIGC